MSLFAQNERCEKVNIAEEIKNSFLDYSMSVIISRALPDVRDGLKPSQRRILYAMRELGVFPGRKTLKCARIVGETIGKYHPHGDQAVYPTLVNMAQPWSMRETLIEGQGNFGSIEGDPPAAMRYTEARLSHLGAALMEDMDKDTVDFQPNYDETEKEPTVLPAAFPNLLVNGGTGIAVGMATNIPPHNLGEVIDAICAQIDNPDISISGLMKHIKGPDFPTGAILVGTEGIRDYFTTGRGTLKLRAKLHTEELKGGREIIVIDEVPYNVNPAQVEERIAELVQEKQLPEIVNLRNESDQNIRLVIELKRDANTKVVINKLYSLTALQTTFSVNLLAIDQRRPKTLNLKELLSCYIEHRRDVVLRRTRFLLNEAEKRADTLEAYLIALANLEEFIRIIRDSRNRDEAKIKLLGYEFPRKIVEQFGIHIRSEARLSNGYYSLQEAQVDAILELRLYQLTAMEVDKIKKEYSEMLEKISDLLDILAREERVLGIIKTELQTIKEKFSTARRTLIVPDEGEMQIEDLIANESMIITLTHSGLIKRTPTSAYRTQRRGGGGVLGVKTRDSDDNTTEPTDFVEHLFTASTHDYLMFFTNTGRVYVERVHEIPEGARTSRGRNIANVLELQTTEKIVAFLRIESRRDPQGNDITWQRPDRFVFFSTRLGTVKKTPLEAFANVRKGGIIAIGIEPGDTLIQVQLTTGNDDVVLITRKGMSIRFNEQDVRSMGRPAAGVRGIALDKDDYVIASVVVDPKATLLVAGENGVGKRTSFEEYRRQSRGGKGIITMKTSDKTGLVAAALTVRDDTEIMCISSKGKMVRIRANEIRETGRNTMGVRLVNLDEGHKLVAMATVLDLEKDTTEEVEPS